MLASFKTPCKKYTRPRKGERHLAVRDDHLSVFVPHGGGGAKTTRFPHSGDGWLNFLLFKWLDQSEKI